MFLVGEQNLFPEDMKVRRAFQIMTYFYPTFDVAYALDLSRQFGLSLKKKIVNLSTGYASIFRLILGLSVNTPYLIFDEPVLGLDAQHRDLFYRLLIEKFMETSCTVVISTHLIAEVENLIDHTIILREGRILRDAPYGGIGGGRLHHLRPGGIGGSIPGRARDFDQPCPRRA